MENLICKALLWKIGLSTGEDYNKKLDEMFLNDSENSILLELESCSSNCDITYGILQRYWKYECKNFSIDSFGKCLLENLKTAYFSNLFSIVEFSKKCYLLWRELPNEIHTKEPFYTLSYSDDPLSWGDEAQTKKIYEELFEFYK